MDHKHIHWSNYVDRNNTALATLFIFSENKFERYCHSEGMRLLQIVVKDFSSEVLQGGAQMHLITNDLWKEYYRHMAVACKARLRFQKYEGWEIVGNEPTLPTSGLSLKEWLSRFFLLAE